MRLATGQLKYLALKLSIMIKPLTHTMIFPMRSIIATTLTIIYLMISLSPLTSLAMNSKTLAHALTGECTGDCDTCGCSIERRSSRTCCCSIKRQQQAHIHDDEDVTPGCCKKKPGEKKTVIANGCPCDSEKQAVLSGCARSEVLPFYFTEQVAISHVDTLFTNPTHFFTSRHIEPPDPPPRQT